ncbi:MAG: enoyl-CoA hydratase/isomerase family protein [Myxococcota bacterium]
MIEIKDQDGVRILQMAHGRANAMDLSFLDALREHVEGASGIEAIVVTGRGSIFCAGVDLNKMLEGGEAYIAAFIPALDRCFAAVATSPIPVVAAINGHAIAGGAILACAADFRVASETGRIGVPELVVGVPFPPVAFALATSSIPPDRFRQQVLRGQQVTGEDRISAGFVDEVVADEHCLARAIEVARELASVPGPAFRTTKSRWRRGVTKAAADTKALAEVTALWRDPATVSHVRSYVERTLRR